jgi:hypothetical protein
MAQINGPLDVKGSTTIDGREISRDSETNRLVLEDGTPISYERDQFQVVVSETDLPDPSNGVITLEPETYYEFNGLVSTDNTIEFSQNSYLAGKNWSNDGLIYTGTGNAITNGTNANVNMRFMVITCPNGGTALSISADQTTEHFMHLMVISDVGSVGTVSGFRVPTFSNVAFESYDEGLTLTGSSNKVFITKNVFREPSSTTSSILFDGSINTDIVDVSGTYFKSHDATSSNAIELASGATVNDFGIVRGNAFDDSTSNITVGFDQTTVGWSFNSNTPIPNSSVRAQISFNNNTTETTINTQDEWVPVVGYGANSDSVLERIAYTHDDTNDTAFFTYLGERTGRALNQSFISAAPANNNQNMEFAVFRRTNSTWNIISSTVTPVTLRTAGDSQFLGLNTYVDANTGDDFQIRCRNTGGTGNVTINSISTTVNV